MTTIALSTQIAIITIISVYYANVVNTGIDRDFRRWLQVGTVFIALNLLASGVVLYHIPPDATDFFTTVALPLANWPVSWIICAAIRWTQHATASSILDNDLIKNLGK